MPVTVKELIIRATIVDDVSSSKVNLPFIGKRDQKKMRESIISDCVDQVLEILEKQKEK